MRVRAAVVAPADPEHGITAIADDVGFGDQGALGRHFKQAVGLSPAAYRTWDRSMDKALPPEIREGLAP